MRQLNIKRFKKLQSYEPTWQAMRQHADQRTQQHAPMDDEIWLLEHHPVFTQGQGGKKEHVLDSHAIPVVNTDRGGQVTYHGPGQLMVYTLFDIDALKMNTREFVSALEQCIITYLDSHSISACRKAGAPGVYVDDAKICSIGLRIRRGISYHGLALNINMDLTPFQYINPCGFKGLAITQLQDFVQLSVDQTIETLIPAIAQIFGYNQWQLSNIE